MMSKVDAFFDSLGRSPLLSPKNFQYACAGSGILCSLFFFFTFLACGFLPPIPANWDAEQTAKHYQDHHKGIHVGSALMLISGMLYLPLTAAISGQMRRVPNLHYSVSALQLASGAAGIFTFMMPAMILATANYRPNRPAEITQVMNEFFWIVALMPWPTFMTQNFAFSYAILIDTRPAPIFPKPIAVVNLLAPIIFIPGIALHTVYTGPLAWNGAISFCLAGMTFCVQLIVDSICLIRIVRTEPPGGETIVENFPTSLKHPETNTTHKEDSDISS